MPCQGLRILACLFLAAPRSWQSCGEVRLFVACQEWGACVVARAPGAKKAPAPTCRQKLLKQPTVLLPKVVAGICRSALFLSTYVALVFAGESWCRGYLRGRASWLWGEKARCEGVPRVSLLPI